ncbi:MAG: GNAT family N-acetyltransferase [Oscillospiraceae bacterium]|nr:GNAT family N-acetyltransferase [Oscillospiraceae bacterium]
MRKATTKDTDAVLQFYETVCSALKEYEYSPCWHYGIYPSPEDLRSHIGAGELLVGTVGSDIAAACVLLFGEDPVYRDVSWPTDAASDEVSELHLFAVRPGDRRHGVSAAMLDSLIKYAGECGKRVVRLDVVKGNLPAERLYQAHGFQFVQERTVFYEDTGELLVRLYELVIRDR